MKFNLFKKKTFNKNIVYFLGWFRFENGIQQSIPHGSAEMHYHTDNHASKNRCFRQTTFAYSSWLGSNFFGKGHCSGSPNYDCDSVASIMFAKTVR